MAQVAVAAASPLSPPISPLPYLPDNSAHSSPIGTEELARYVRASADGARRLRAEDFRFVRTAQIDDKRYWLWRYRTRAASGWATVMQEPDGSAWMAHHPQGAASADDVLRDDYRNAF